VAIRHPNKTPIFIIKNDMNEQWEKAKKILEKHNLPEKITQQNIKFLSALLVRDFEDLIDFEGIILQTNKELLDDFTRLSYYQIVYWNYFLETEQYENCNVVKSSIQNLKNLTVSDYFIKKLMVRLSPMKKLKNT
jgi:hypothetical protein